MSMKQKASSPLKILTVGDGDLTFSLALLRAYNNNGTSSSQQQIDLVATTLEPSVEALCKTYDNSKSVVEELLDRGAVIEYGVDATHLTSYPYLVAKEGFDLILFHHPHLGLGTIQDEQYHAHRHFVLLAHYLASCKALLSSSSSSAAAVGDNNDEPTIKVYDGRIGLCLAHDQPQTWKLEEAAQRQGLELVKKVETQVAFHDIISELDLSQRWWCSVPSTRHPPPLNNNNQQQKLVLAPPEPHFKAPRRYRNGKLGSMHFLGKYGYRHRRTHGDLHNGREGDMNVQGSRYFFFAMDENQLANKQQEMEEGLQGTFCCSICGSDYPTELALDNHLKAPALPDQPTGGDVENHTTRKEDATNKKELSSPQTTPNSSSHHSKPLTPAERDAILQTFPLNWVVAETDEGKRLRRFLQHVALPKLSKKQNDILVAKGKIWVNGEIALDTSRILHSGDVVSSRMAESPEELSATAKTAQQSETTQEISIVSTFSVESIIPNKDDYFLVVQKPAGMRIKGNSGCSGTCEQLVSSQRKLPYKSLSTIDTGCPGLTVLQLQQQDGEKNASIDNRLEQEFTALVHGQVPLEWESGITVEVPWRGVRQWRRKIEKIPAKDAPEQKDGAPRDDRNDNIISPDDESDGEEKDYRSDDNNPWMMSIRCIERTCQRDQPSAPPNLCTLNIATTCPVSGLCKAICLYLRKQYHPVVGDCKSQREYATLPRSVRNRIKKKLCLGCYKIQLDANITNNNNMMKEQDKAQDSHNNDDLTKHHWECSVDIPDKLRAEFWQHHCENAITSVPMKNEKANTPNS